MTDRPYPSLTTAASDPRVLLAVADYTARRLRCDLQRARRLNVALAVLAVGAVAWGLA